jgi:hypothetical protein
VQGVHGVLKPRPVVVNAESALPVLNVPAGHN